MSLETKTMTPSIDALKRAALLGALTLASATAQAFPFWLQAPVRSNPHDPKSAQYIAPVATLPVAAYNSPTDTPTQSPVQSPTFTRTNSPAATLTSTPTASPIASSTASPTVSPVFSATSSPTASPFFSATSTRTNAPTSTFTMTPTLGSHTALVADLESVGTNDRTLWNGGVLMTQKDGNGSTQVPNPFGPTSATAGGAFGSSSYAACMSGTMVTQSPTASIYPYCFMAFELVLDGSKSLANGGVDIDPSSYSPNHGIKFDYKAGAAGVVYHVKLAQTVVTDYGYYEYAWTSTDSAWHTLEIWFPGTPSAPALFAQPGWATPRTWSETAMGAIIFEPIPQQTGPVNYDICIDNLSFAVSVAASAATATPTPTPTLSVHTALVADMEGVGTDDRTLWNNGLVLTVRDGVGSTCSPYPYGATSDTAGGAYGSSSYAACFSGTMVMQDGGNGIYPYNLIGFELVTGGTAPLSSGGSDVDVSSYSPNQGIKFDYKAGAAGIPYRVKLTSTLVTDFGYYEYIFTPADTAWHTQEVWFPGTAGATAVLAQPGWAAPKTFDQTKIGGFLFEPVQSTTGTVAYDLCVDNLTFAVSAAPTPVVTPTFGAGTMIADFEDNLANDVTLAPFGREIVTGYGNGGTVNPDPWTASSGTAPGSSASGPASAYAGCFDGSLPAASGNPWSVLELRLVTGGYGNGGGSVNITPYAPAKRLIFDYKAAGAGITYGVQMVTQNIADYCFYEYDWTSTDANWHQMVIYFPDAAASLTPKFTQPGWGAAQPWAPNLVGEVLFRVAPQAAPLTYGLCIDNLRFD